MDIPVGHEVPKGGNMNVAEKLNRELKRLESLGEFGGQPLRVQLDVEQGQLVCELLRLDSIGCQLGGIRFQTDQLADASIERLKELGETLTGRLSYLMEPICPIEIDPEACVVQLRSNPPRKESDGTYYFELLVHRGGEVSLHRFHKSVGDVRNTVPADMTREALTRLATDLTTL